MSLSLLILLFLTLAVLTQVPALSRGRLGRLCPTGLTSVLIPSQEVRERRCPERVMENIPPPGIDTQLANVSATGSYCSIVTGAYAPSQNLSS
ncbi:MAG TPA: hypothetical protein DCG12_14170 [Planctomycetaceae bacterium]|nr:hypothetical protein [Planctomycetaceae bacterium]